MVRGNGHNFRRFYFPEAVGEQLAFPSLANQSAQRDYDVIRKNSAVGNNRNSQLISCAIKRVVFSIAFGGFPDAYD
ncbi:hypothetical protein OAX09_05005 [Gammaproteobacteria bacterium]|jgi:hypothetical protein|nr:hypothetical protein [Gammaproteobacteria bacterium]